MNYNYCIDEEERMNMIERIELYADINGLTKGVYGQVVSNMVSDTPTYDEYVNVIRVLERETQNYNFVKSVINSIYEVHSTALGDAISREHTHPKTLTYSQIEALRNYVSEDYEIINGALLGENDMTDEITDTINLLDAVIDSTNKLNCTLYRGQTLDIGTMNRIIEDKEFKFENFVSTSYAPIIFGGWMSNSTSLYCENRYESEQGKLQHTCNVSWVIDVKDSHGFVVGPVAWNPCECEVILPRGTRVKVNDVVESFGNEIRRQFTVFCEVI